jgi:hypothetical protein
MEAPATDSSTTTASSTGGQYSVVVQPAPSKEDIQPQQNIAGERDSEIHWDIL